MAILTARSRTQLRVMSVVVCVACVLTPVFNMLTNEVSIDSALQGFVDALFVSVVLGGYIVFVRDGVWRAWLRERSFVANLLINGTAMLMLYLLMRGLGQVATSGDLSDFAELRLRTETAPDCIVKLTRGNRARPQDVER
jgi:hypothetical protein